MNRRTFLFGALGAGALTAIGAVPFALVDEDAVLLAAIDAIFPPLEGMPTGAEVDAAAAFRRYIANLPTRTRFEARGLLRAIEVGAAATTGSRFTVLDRDGRTVFLEGLLDGVFPQRLLANGLKQVCAVAYWQHPRTWTALAYDGPLVGRSAP